MARKKKNRLLARAFGLSTNKNRKRRGRFFQAFVGASKKSKGKLMTSAWGKKPPKRGTLGAALSFSPARSGKQKQGAFFALADTFADRDKNKRHSSAANWYSAFARVPRDESPVTGSPLPDVPVLDGAAPPDVNKMSTVENAMATVDDSGQPVFARLRDFFGQHITALDLPADATTAIDDSSLPVFERLLNFVEQRLPPPPQEPPSVRATLRRWARNLVREPKE